VAFVPFSTKGPFFIRLKDNRLITDQDGCKKSLKSFFEHLPEGQESAFYATLNDLNLHVMGKRIGADFVIVCSNVKDPSLILKTYKQRWTIETCFKNMKLMAIVAVTILVTSFAGILQKNTFKKTVMAPLHSLFTRGLRFLKRTLFEPNFYQYFDLSLTYFKSEG
jgi:hypothetical protein